MKKSLILILSSITLLSLSYTKVNAASIEEGVAGISTSLNMIALEEVKFAFNITDMWTTDRLNLRKEGDINSDIIITLDKRCKVKMLVISGCWSKVKYGGRIGWVSSEYLTDNELFISDNNRWNIELNDDEIDLLAKIVWAESSGEEKRRSTGGCRMYL